MIDLKLILQNTEEAQRKLSLRHEDYDLAKIRELAEKRVRIQTQLDQARSERNRISKEIGNLIRQGKTEDAERLKAEAGLIPSQMESLDQEFHQAESEINGLLLQIPNLPDQSVPVGASDQDNKVERVIGHPRSFSFKPKDHIELGESLGIMDFEAAARIAGARFSLLIGDGARLERSLINFMLNLHTRDHGYTEILPPFMGNPDTFLASGHLPKFEQELFKVQPFGWYLVPTAEVPLTNIYRDQIINDTDLPIKLCAYTPCFRSEAGSYGKDIRGLIRLHLFDKVELYKFVAPDQSFQELEGLVKDAGKVLELLGLPYRVVSLCTADLGFSSAKTYDLEVWLPGQNCYREISSCSNCSDFQARRAGIRFKKSGRKGTELVHTLNGSGLAVGRTMVAILENFQEEDGTVRIPEALWDYMGKKEINPSKKL